MPKRILEDTMSLSVPERDLLVTLNTKVDQLTLDVREVRDGLAVRMGKAEQRLDQIDVYHARVPMKRYEDLASWVEGFKSNYRMVLIFGGLIMGVVGAVVERLVATLLHL